MSTALIPVTHTFAEEALEAVVNVTGWLSAFHRLFAVFVAVTYFAILAPLYTVVDVLGSLQPLSA
ncbi:hypothetical protein [Propionicimonas sp.]|uniref:hypothetical protein n=1 Tax=Propionicimonas sp. TaxID=1955623 RepID=UPI003D138DD6